MSEPIISPWVIYLILQWGFIYKSIMCILFISVVFLFSFFACFTYQEVELSKNSEEEEFYAGKSNGALKLTIFFLAFTFFVFAFLPTQKTVIACYASSKITWEEVENVSNLSIDIKNRIKEDVIEVLQSLDKSGKEIKEKLE